MECGRQTVNISARLAQATSEFNKLTAFWAHAGICTSLKLRTYKAIIYPIVTYALHYSWMTKAMCTKIDSWQARTLRRVLRVKASMISHISNAEVLSRAHCTPLSHHVRSSRFKYFGHVLRRDYSATIFNVCFDSSCKVRQPAGKRKQKRPLDAWTRKTMSEVLDHSRRTLESTVRPRVGLDPLSSGVLYARKLANNKQVWGRLTDRRTYAPTGGLAGAGARHVRARGAPAVRPPRGAG